MKTHGHPDGNRNYWHHLDSAFQRLAAGDFAGAEDAYFTAVELRQASPGRVFLTESIGDRLQRMLRRGPTQVSQVELAGRWERRSGRLRDDFLEQADQVVREGLRLAGLRPEEEAASNQPVLERALFLVSRSRLFPAEHRSAVPLLKGLFRTARETGRPFSHDLVRHDLPLTEEDRLWLAAKGGGMLEAFIEQENLRAGSPEAREWASAVLQLLRREYFGSSGRLEAERCWLEAVSADRLLGQPGSCVALYRQYLDHAVQPGPRVDEARLRILEILANVDELHLPVPRYEEALAVLEQGLTTADQSLEIRRRHALDCVGYRRPGMGRRSRESLTWASVGLEEDGSLAFVLWWDDQPRDMAFWRPGTGTDDLDAFLESCDRRIVGWSQEVARSMGEHGVHSCGPCSVQGLVAAVLEPWLPSAGMRPEVLLRLGLAETGPWRRDWVPRLGHRHLTPPRGSGGTGGWDQRPGRQALLAGLLVLAVRSRLERSDPSLRAGIGELGRRGDGVAGFLYELVSLHKPGVLALDATFSPWTLPLLWTRPDPWRREQEADGDPASAARDVQLQPDLGRHDLALVATGSPGPVLEAWGGESAKWRVVWDGPVRAGHLVNLAGRVLGPVTLIPRRGMVHDLGSALVKLEKWIVEAQRGNPETSALLPVFHWCRLVECHNGDLHDYCDNRDRTNCNIELYDIYNQEIDGLEQVPVEAGAQDGWSQQYVQRARKSGLLAGPWQMLNRDPGVLDARWGVFDGSDASWVFLDSAAVHRGLLGTGTENVHDLQVLLCSRGHRHLSLLLGSAWMTDALEDYLGYLLRAFGRAYRLTLQDRRLPVLKLVDRGLRPDGRLLRKQALAQQVDWIRDQAETGDLSVLLPAPTDPCGPFWRDVAAGALGGSLSGVDFLAPEAVEADTGIDGGGVLVLPVLPGLDAFPVFPDSSGDACRWQDLDAERDRAFEAALARCALDLAGHMAGPWSEVVVLDVRWWHMLWGRSYRPDTELEEGEPWSFSTALRICGAVDAQPLQLGTGSAAHREETETESVVGRWLAAHGEETGVQVSGPGSGGMASTREGAVTLAYGPDAQTWKSWADRISQAREQGQLAAWMLMVADSCEESWRSIIAGDFAPGCSVPGPGGFSGPPAALVWATPRQMTEASLLQALHDQPPVVIHVQDLDSWLPDADDERHTEAAALYGILQNTRSRVILHAERLAEPWVEFLQELLGRRFEVAGSGPPSAPALPPAGPGGSGQARLRRLLTGLRPLLTAERGHDPGPSGLASAYELMPLSQLAWLSGLSAPDVAFGIRLLRWSLKVAGVPLPAVAEAGDVQVGAESAAGYGQSHAVLIRRRFAELEHDLDGLERNLGLLLPFWLQGLGPGMRSWIDLEHPRAEVAESELVLLDSFLGLGGGGSGRESLIYRCPSGALNSNSRWVGCDAAAASMMQELLGDLGRFKFRLQEMMDAAVETPGGFLFDTGLRHPGSRERDFLALGSALGLWRWMGPADDEVVSLVDLLALADVAGRQGHEQAWGLCARLMESRTPTAFGMARQTESSPGTGKVPRSPLRSLRNLLGGRGMADQEIRRNGEAVAHVVGTDEPGLVVLTGAPGTGRHEALVGGMVEAFGGTELAPEVRVFCPDAAVAAQVSLEFMHLGPDIAYSLEIPEVGAVLSGRVGRLRPTVPGRVIVLCEAQRFPSELRYKISQLGREGRLLVTVDPWASEESWEDLFLTVPRPEQIAACTFQRRQARKLWSQVVGLFPQDKRLAAGNAVRAGGVLKAEYAANLDQCLGRLFADLEAGDPDTMLRVLAGVRSDLDYLGSSLADRGWAVVPEDRLEPWLATGPREFMAVLMDMAAGRTDLLCPRLMPSLDPTAWSSFCLEHGQDLREMNLAGLWTRLQGEGFLQEVMSHAGCRERVNFLLASWGRMDWVEFVAHPVATAVTRILFQAWDLSPPAEARPVAVLTPADHLPGIWMPAAMYLCLGSEPARRHYLQWSRVSERLMVLYQERSPVPGRGGR